MKHLVIAGCGDVGTALAKRMLQQGWQVSGLQRDPSGLPEGIGRIAGDLTDAQPPSDWPAKVDYLVYCPAAGRRDPELYQRLYIDGLGHALDWVKASGSKLRHLLQVSSTGVYGQSEGEWVTENSPALADTSTGPLLVKAEDVALRSGVPASVVRLGGIYGPGRNRLIEQVRKGLHVPTDPPQYTNRIHRDDAAGLLEHLLLSAAQGELLAPCYLGVDNEPAALHEVADWMAQQLGVSLLDEGPTANRNGSKRCSNALALDSGWTPQYPSYREGYAALLQRRADEP